MQLFHNTNDKEKDSSSGPSDAKSDKREPKENAEYLAYRIKQFERWERALKKGS
jgi:hypothetical protein